MLGMGVGIENRDDFVLPLVVNAIKFDDRMLLVIFQFFVAFENIEHLTIGTDAADSVEVGRAGERYLPSWRD